MHRSSVAQVQRSPWRVLGLASLLALLAACGGGGGGGGGAGAGGDSSGGGSDAVTLNADVYPVATGDRRTWGSTAAPGEQRSERVGAAVSVPAGSALALRRDDGSVEYLQVTAGAVLAVPGPGSDVLTTAAGPIELLRFGLVAGQTAVTYDRTLSVDLNADGRADSVDLRLESTFVGYETVDTAAGRFTGVARVRTFVRTVARLAGGSGSETVTTTSDDWYAPGVGPVRSSVTLSSNGVAAPTETEELVAYGVGNRRSESVAPTLVSSSPGANATVGRPASLSLDFSEALDPLTLDGAEGLTLVNAAGAAVAVDRDILDAGRQIVLRPRSALPDGRYELRTGSAVTDLANNPLQPTVRAFTVDTTGPRIVSSTPADGAEDGALSGALSLRFDEPLFASGTSPVMLRLEMSGLPTTYLPAVIQGNEIVATLSTPLERNRAYLLSIDSTVTDAAGNAVPIENGNIRFRTDPGPLSRPTALMNDAAVQAVTLGDLDGDGRRDLVFVAQQAGSSTYFVAARFQQPDGSHAAPVRLHTLNSPGICATRGLVVADFDGDGRGDIALTGCGFIGTGVMVLRQVAGGSFVAETAALNISSSAIAATNRLGDGRAELLTVGTTQFSFLRRDATGAWTTALSVDAGTDYVAAWQLADLNGDGRTDLVWLRIVGNNSGYELAWALREGTGFGAERSIALDSAVAISVPAPALAVGDVSGDGRADVLLLSQTDATSRLVVLRQNATGAFDTQSPLASAYGAATATVGDVNGDGRLDVVLSHSTLSRVGVHLQAADGSLEAERLFDSGNGYFEGTDAVALADLNGDGRTDIVVTDSVLLGRAYTGVWPAQAGGAAARARALATPGTAATRPASAAPRPAQRALRALRSAAAAR